MYTTPLPNVTSNLTRIVTVRPAWDKRSKDPNKNYGIHCAEIVFMLQGNKRSIQFVISTGWYLPHNEKELKGTASSILWERHGSDVGYHSPVPMYEGQTAMPDCPITGGDCYYDGSGLQAYDLLNVLVAEGSDAVWAKMEEIYLRRFGTVEE